MNTEFFNALDILEKEKGIPKEYMLEKVEAALVAAFKRDNNGNSNVRVVMDPVKKDVKVYSVKNIVEEVMDPETEISLEAAKAISRRYVLGGVVETEIKTKSFGRISAQTASTSRTAKRFTERSRLSSTRQTLLKISTISRFLPPA